MQRGREPQIESGIIDQHDRIRFALRDFSEGVGKLFSKIAVVFDHFPEAEHAGLIDPVIERRAGDSFHLRPAAAEKLKIDIRTSQRLHERGAVIIRARLAGNEIQPHNDEIRMTNDETNPNDETQKSARHASQEFVIRASSFLRHSSFVLRHSLCDFHGQLQRRRCLKP